MADISDRFSEGQVESYLHDPYGSRRQKAILDYLERAEEEFKDYGLRSIVEAMAREELLPFNNYNNIDQNLDLSLAAALWILDNLRRNGKLYEASKLLPDMVELPDAEWYLPENFTHPCYEDDLIRAVIFKIQNRYSQRKT